MVGKTICQDLFEVIPHLPDGFVDLLIADPPYNLDKSFNGNAFKACPSEDYEAWIESWLVPLRRILKPTASLYLCGDWRSSSAIQGVAQRDTSSFKQNHLGAGKGPRGLDELGNSGAEDFGF